MEGDKGHVEALLLPAPRGPGCPVGHHTPPHPPGPGGAGPGDSGSGSSSPPPSHAGGSGQLAPPRRGGAGTGQGLHVKRPPASCGERAKETKPCLPAIGATIGQAVHPLAGAAVWGDIVGRSVLAGVGLPEKSTGPAGKQVITQRMSLAILGTYLC